MRSRLPTICGLLLALGGPPLFALVSERLLDASPRLGVQLVLQLLYCTLPLLIIWITLRFERLPLRSIGLKRPGWSSIAWGVLLWGVLLILPTLTSPLMQVLGTEGVDAEVQRLAALPLWFRVILGLTGGVVEEMLYRGYAVERFITLTGRPWMGAAIPAVIFGLAHIPAWGPAFALGADLPFGLVMTAFYVWRRDLAANIIAHSGGLVVSLATL